MGVLVGTLVLPAPEGNSKKFWSASSPRGSGRAESVYPMIFPMQMRAGDGTKEPTRAQHRREEATSQTGRRAPISNSSGRSSTPS